MVKMYVNAFRHRIPRGHLSGAYCARKSPSLVFSSLRSLAKTSIINYRLEYNRSRSYCHVLKAFITVSLYKLVLIRLFIHYTLTHLLSIIIPQIHAMYTIEHFSSLAERNLGQLVSKRTRYLNKNCTEHRGSAGTLGSRTCPGLQVLGFELR